MYTIEQVREFGRYKGRCAVHNAVIKDHHKEECHCTTIAGCSICRRKAAYALLEAQYIADDAYTGVLMMALYSMGPEKRKVLFRAFLKGKREGVEFMLARFNWEDPYGRKKSL